MHKTFNKGLLLGSPLKVSPVPVTTMQCKCKYLFLIDLYHQIHHTEITLTDKTVIKTAGWRRCSGREPLTGREKLPENWRIMPVGCL